MQRYLVFSGQRTQPLGGWLDFQADVYDLDLAIAEAERACAEPGSWAQVVDMGMLEAGVIVLLLERSAAGELSRVDHQRNLDLRTSRG